MVTEYGKKHSKKDEAEIRELIGMAVGGDKQSFMELAEINRNLIIEFLSNRVFRKALENVIVPKLAEETVEKAQKEITAIKHDEQKEIGKFFVRIARRTWKTNEIKKRMEQAVTGDQDVLGELFKIYHNTLEDFFYERICGASKNDHRLPKSV